MSMDIAITLPKDLWKKIVSGEKIYELRKSFPRKLKLKTGKVYVVLKGTKKVAGYFNVTSFCKVSAYEACLMNKGIGVHPAWIAGYLGIGMHLDEEKTSAYLWNIGDTTELLQTVRANVNLHLKSNPQSFCYIK